MVDDPDTITFKPLPGSFNTGDRDHTIPVSVTRVLGPVAFEAYVYHAKLVEDYDGSSTAYGWDRPDSDVPKGEVNLQKNLRPLESRHGQQAGLANAASPWTNLWHNHDFSWVGVVSATKEQAWVSVFDIDNRPQLRDKHGKFPVIQPADGPAPGYYVSQCPAIVDKSKNWWDQRRYADANTFPYIVLPNLFASQGCRIGDAGLAIRNQTGKSAAFVFGDTGTYSHLGESSSFLYRTVTEGQGNADYVSFVVFPRSGNGSAEGLKPGGDINLAVWAGIRQLSYAPNAEEFPLFLALGADLGRFRETLKKIKEGKPVNVSIGELGRIVRALGGWGYDPDGLRTKT